MKRSIHWLVADAAIDAATDPNHCRWCRQEIGQEHKEGCMARERTVVMLIGATIVVSVPEHWSEKQAEDALSGKTTCGNAALHSLEMAIESLLANERCGCGLVQAGFIREATADDEARYCIRVNELPS